MRLLAWVLGEAAEPTLMGEAGLTTDEMALLLPARETRNAARRLTLEVWVEDGRRHARFQCDGECLTQLRVGLAAGRLRLNVGPPHRGEEADRTDALPLFQELREQTTFSLIPAARDAGSLSFRSSLRTAVGAKLRERAVHARRGGAAGEYRTVRRALQTITAVSDGLVAPFGTS